MGYRIELLVDESTYFSGGSVGHAFLKLTDESGNVEYRGFYPKSPTFSIFTGYSKASIHTQNGENDNDESKHEFTRGRIFDITKNQYDAMMSEISNIETRVGNGTTTYDLFDGDSGTSDFNCVTFANHILNEGGINVDIGIIPQVAISSSYANEYGETYYDNLNTTIGDGKSPASISYTNGYMIYTDGSWENHTTIPSTGINIDTVYNKLDKNLSVTMNQEITDKGFANAILKLTDKINTETLTLNNQTYNIASDNNNLLVRNAIDSIPTVSFLLSHIDIKSGEVLDIGNKGLYTIKSGDTMSEIAESKGMTTQELLKLNTWLIDDGRVSFNQKKVLVDVNANFLTNKNHVYQGTSAEDRLIDKNGGLDTYIAGNNDTIIDNDNKGRVLFKDIDLTGRKKLNKETNLYEDDDFTYTKEGIVTHKGTNESITLENWENRQLGIELVDNDDIEISITESNSTNEGNSGTQSMNFTLTLSRALEDGESLSVAVSNTKEQSYTFSSGESTKTFTHTWQGDTQDEGSIDHTATLTPTVVEYKGESEDVKVTVKNSGEATVYDDDTRPKGDPLVLDTNKDGFISTSSLENSNTYFDLTGDGLREKVGWIKPEDALLVYDKNENGQINGISEVFGNLNKSGFEELKQLIDSNHDNKIDRRDELYNQLQVWNDTNQDAKVQTRELRTLSQADVKSIDLNIVETNIEINGNLLTEASKYAKNTYLTNNFIFRCNKMKRIA